MRSRIPCVYMLASNRNGTLYTGVTSNLIRRVAQHRMALASAFTREHKVHRLVWYERHETMQDALAREKAIKKWRRSWKIEMIELGNPQWLDLYEVIGF